MGVDHQVAVSVVGPGGDQRRGSFHVVERAPVVAALHEPAVVEVDEMPLDLHPLHRAPFRVLHTVGDVRRSRHHAEDLRRRDRQAEDPAVHDVLQPVLIGPQREALLSPIPAPGVLDDEALGLVSDDREGVPAGMAGLELDQRQLALLAGRRFRPAAVYIGGDIDRAGLVQRRVIVGDHRPQAVIGPERVAPRRDRAIDGQAGVILGLLVGPDVFLANAHVVPAANCAPATRSLVFFAGPLVVLLCHLVEHPRAGAKLVLPLPVFEQVDDGSQAKAGARALGALIEHQVGHDTLERGPQLDQGRFVLAIAKIGRVAQDVQRSLFSANLQFADFLDLCWSLLAVIRSHGGLPVAVRSAPEDVLGMVRSRQGSVSNAGRSLQESADRPAIERGPAAQTLCQQPIG
jgi:hypothetical protein